MGKIWVQTSSGKIIHLPIVEDDVNTPDDTIKIPTGVFISDRHPPSMCAWLGLAFISLIGDKMADVKSINGRLLFFYRTRHNDEDIGCP